MQLPEILKGESRTNFLKGIALGAIATIAIGFFWGGWVTAGSARQQATVATESAVIATLAPICVEQFQNAENAVANLASLKEQSTYRRAGFIEKGGWAVAPGSEEPGDGVAKACAVILNDLAES